MKGAIHEGLLIDNGVVKNMTLLRQTRIGLHRYQSQEQAQAA